MMDLYVFNTVINSIWYLFTILFVLYKFTSFFSYAYNFFKFCTKLWSFLKWAKDQITVYLRKRKGYTYLSSQTHPLSSVVTQSPSQAEKDDKIADLDIPLLELDADQNQYTDTDPLLNRPFDVEHSGLLLESRFISQKLHATPRPPIKPPFAR